MRSWYISKIVLTTIFAMAGFWFTEERPASAHSGRTLSAYTALPPAIGGWGPAACESVALPDRTGSVCVMNDANNLYILLSVPDMAVDPREGWALFDNDHTGLGRTGDDGWRIKFSGGIYEMTDQFRWDGPYFESIPFGTWDISDGGTQDGGGKTDTVAVSAYFDFVHPLDSGDLAHDIRAKCDPSARQIVGVNFGARALPSFTGGGFAYPIRDPIGWDDIKIACPGDPREQPAGGQVRILNANISQLPDSIFRNGLPELRATLVSKVDELTAMIDAGNFQPAAKKLANDVIPKLNPAAKNCWVCGVSPDPYQSALELLAEIEAVLGTSPEPTVK